MNNVTERKGCSVDEALQMVSAERQRVQIEIAEMAFRHAVIFSIMIVVIVIMIVAAVWLANEKKADFIAWRKGVVQKIEDVVEVR